MANYKSQVILILVFFGKYFVCNNELYATHKIPRVAISIVPNSNALHMPYFLTCLEKLEYPKDRLDIWLHPDNNDTKAILNTWAENKKHLYHSLHIHSREEKKVDDGDGMVKAFPDNDQDQCISTLREEALQYARKTKADFLFALDPNAIITEPDTLKILVGRNYKIAAPMLISDGLQSNFWAGETKDSSYEQSSYYLKFVKREILYLGCHNVPAVHSAVLISLKHNATRKLTYRPPKNASITAPVDDVTNFATSARQLGLKIKLCNDLLFGFVGLPNADYSMLKDSEKIINLKLAALGHEVEFPLDPNLKKYVAYPKRSSYGCDKIFMINLERRPKRKMLMQKTFVELGMEVKRVSAVDGLILNQTILRRMNLKLMPGYEDPYHRRPMKYGELGCLMSHAIVWNKIVSKKYSLAMVLEDDVRFTPNFREYYYQMLAEVERLDFDMIYLGRKILMEGDEEPVTAHTTRPRYSYWTVGYLLTFRGAQKLLAAKPLSNMLPVDEFLPIMFDQHPNTTWKSYFPNRNLIALSARPLLVQPTLYTGMPGYVSDTERSSLINTKTYILRRDL